MEFDLSCLVGVPGIEPPENKITRLSAIAFKYAFHKRVTKEKAPRVLVYTFLINPVTITREVPR